MFVIVPLVLEAGIVDSIKICLTPDLYLETIRYLRSFVLQALLSIFT